MSSIALLLPGWIRLVVVGVFLSSGFWLSFYIVETASGAAPAAMGQLAEQWTARELSRLKRQGWNLVNHLTLQRSDIDHVLMGPGGIVIVETKYSSGGWENSYYTNGLIESASTYVSKSAHTFLLWAGKRMLPQSCVYPVVVLWGGGYDDTKASPVEGVHVLSGNHLQGWLSTLPEAVMNEANLAAIYAKIDTQVEWRDQKDLERDGPRPRSILTWYLLITGVIFSALLASFCYIEILRTIGWHWFPLVGIALTTPAIVAWNSRLHRAVSIAWVCGSQVFTLVFVIAYAAKSVGL